MAPPVLAIPRWRGQFARFFDRHRSFAQAHPAGGATRCGASAFRGGPVGVASKSPEGTARPGTSRAFLHRSASLSGRLRTAAGWWRVRRGGMPERPGSARRDGFLRRRTDPIGRVELGAGAHPVVHPAGGTVLSRGQRVLAEGT